MPHGSIRTIIIYDDDDDDDDAAMRRNSRSLSRLQELAAASHSPNGIIPKSRSVEELYALEGDSSPSSTLLEPKDSIRPKRTLSWKHGTTQWEILGPAVDASRGVVVLIHGLTLASYIWTDLAQSLASRGFSVLIYDLCGRGSSEYLSDAACNAAFFVEQLAALVDAAEIGCKHGIPFTLCGASMGGGIAAAFSHAFPQSVSRVILIAPAGLMPSLPVPARVIRGKFGRMFSCICACLLRARMSSTFAGSRWEEEIHDDMSRPGFAAAYISTLTHFPFTNLSRAFRSIGRDAGRPVLVIWGEVDSVVDFAQSKQVRRLIAHAKFCPVPLRGHALATGEGDTSEVIALVQEFLLLNA